MKKYFKHKIENLIIINKIVTVHYFEFSKNFSSPGESHDFWEMVYADKGNIICSADKNTLLLKQGELLFHKPNEFHKLSADGKNAPNVFIISFDCKSEAIRYFENKKIQLDAQLKKYIYMIVNESRKTFDIPFSDPNLTKLRLLTSPTLGGQQLIKNYLEILIINILRNATETKEGNTVFIKECDLDNKLIKDILSFLKNNVYGKITIDDICKKFGYGRSQIFKQFKKNINKSVMEYYTFIKIEQAKQLLREKNYSVKQISDMLCFDTPNYFSKTFKRIVGDSPTQYINKLAH